MTGAHCESEDKENASQNVRLAKKCEQKDDSENEKLRSENEKLRSENEKLRSENERLRNAVAEAERAAASAKSQWLSTGHEFIGKRVRRFFPGFPSADGVVKKWRPPTEDEDGTVQFHVEHVDDGDEEDLDEAELKAGIKAYTLDPSDLGLSIGSAITVQFPFATSGRRGAGTKLLPCTATLCLPDSTDECATGRVGEFVLLYNEQHDHPPERRLVVFCEGQPPGLWDEELGQRLQWEPTPAPCATKAKPARRRAPPKQKDPDFVEKKVRAPNPSPGSDPDHDPAPDPGRRFGLRRCGARRDATRSRPSLPTPSSSS